MMFKLLLKFVFWGLILSTSSSSTYYLNSYQRISRDYIYKQHRIPVYTYHIVKKYPHRRDAFTEGFVVKEGVVYESSGRFGQSTLTKYQLNIGDVIKQYRLPKQFFAEGLTLLNNDLYQLTYKKQRGFIYNQSNLNVTSTFKFDGQGWGLTNDSINLILSNGSSTLVFYDPDTFKIDRTVTVHDQKSQVANINELDYINGTLFANIWLTDLIAMISPQNGEIVGWIDLTGINPEPALLKYPHVLNGIAYNKKTNHLLVTGKNWPAIYEIQLMLKGKEAVLC